MERGAWVADRRVGWHTVHVCEQVAGGRETAAPKLDPQRLRHIHPSPKACQLWGRSPGEAVSQGELRAELGLFGNGSSSEQGVGAQQVWVSTLGWTLRHVSASMK